MGPASDETYRNVAVAGDQTHFSASAEASFFNFLDVTELLAGVCSCEGLSATEASVDSPVFAVGVASVWAEPSRTNGLISSDTDCG